MAETLGAIPKPQRVLTQPYTVEPTQEGERSVMLRRVGNIQGIMVVYHIPAALHPDMAPLEVMAQVLGAPQTGRLYKALVDQQEGRSRQHERGRNARPRGCAWPSRNSSPINRSTKRSRPCCKTVEGLASEPPSQEEVDRAKGRILKNIELAVTNSQSMALMLGGYVGDGDWRSFYLTRDEVKQGHAGRCGARGEGLSEILQSHAG